MALKITSLSDLKQQSSEGGDFFILLNGYMKSSKRIQWIPAERLFHLFNYIDDSRQKLTESQMMNLDFTNIGLAIRSGSFFKEEHGGEKMEEKAKSKLMKKFQKGRVWLNVVKSDDGTELFTLNRSFKANDGWVNSPFFQLEKKDVESIMGLLDEYQQWRTSRSIAIEEESDEEPVVEYIVKFGEDVITLPG